MKKMAALAMALFLALALTACGEAASESQEAGGKVYKIGICNYVDDASLNQIAENLQARLKELGEEAQVSFQVEYMNCQADSSLLQQIISDFAVDKVDLMVAIATPVAMAMQAATEDSGTPVVFAAVSDPVGAGLVDSLEQPGANVTGTSDYLDTEAVMKLMLAVNPDIKTVGLLYDMGQDSSTAPIAAARAFLAQQGITVVERTGTNVTEMQQAASELAAAKVQAVFTPTDNTVMQAELSIYETLAAAGIPHYTGADSFALNGAFLGYGVDYANLGQATADMIKEILVDGRKPAELAVRTFDNGTATVNTEICAALNMDLAQVKEAITPYCLHIQEITTAEEFD